MNIQKLKYKFHSGKNSKPWYYIKEYARLYTPACILIWRGQRLLAKAKKRKDYDYILSRVNYYNKLTENYLHLNKDLWEKKAVKVAEQPMTHIIWIPWSMPAVLTATTNGISCLVTSRMWKIFLPL